MRENNEIALLDQGTIDKIAAGEVVERPASVVKELVENAIDAKACDITIEIRDGGMTLIRISDNGCGIPSDQLPRAFLRHSTSKIRDAEDLLRVRSLGFRGEALSSIAAVSKVEVLTKTREAFVGASYSIEGGRETEHVDIGTPDGTTIFVRKLFYNTPARRKFLKSPMTEGNYVSNIVERLALSHPDISFRFINNGREQLVTPGSGRLPDVIYQVYGRETARGLLEISAETQEFTLSGWIGEPSIGRGNRAGESFFVNGRYVKSRIIAKALEEGYQGFLMQHKFPFAVLVLTFAEDSVDVNVHPTKQEVRFFDEPLVFETVKAAVKERLTHREDIREMSLPGEEKPQKPQPQTPGAEPFERERLDRLKEQIAASIQQDSPYMRQYEPRPRREIPESAASTPDPQGTSPVLEETVVSKSAPHKTYGPIIEGAGEQLSFLSEEAKPSHRIIGQLFSVYWLVEYNNNLFIIDQHAAHEKVLYERFVGQLADKEMTSQQLSPPIIVSLNKLEQAALEEHREALTQTGYAAEPFGGSEYAITAIPGNLVDVDVKDLFLTIIADLASGKKTANLSLIKDRIATMSCKAAVKENDRMSMAEADALITELLSLAEPYHCPHGRPTMIKMSKTKLDKEFRRIVS